MARMATWMVAAGIAAGSVAAASPAWAASEPHYTWDEDTGTIYFDKTETAQLTYPAGVATVRAVAAEPFGRLIGANATAVMVEAGSASVVGQCVKITSTGTVGTYGAGYCQ